MSNNLWIAAVLIVVVSSADLISGSVSDSDQATVENKSFDFLIFAQIWPITSCDIWEAESSSNTCFLPQGIDGRWTIHGIWPSSDRGMGPFFCNKSAQFDPHSLNPIVDKLNVQWTDVHKNGPLDDFWKHEWTKHGTCAMQLAELSSELRYFSKGLDWNERFDISEILTRSDILPGGVYSGKEVIEKLTSALGKRPGIECVKNKHDFGDDKEAKLLLSQVMICMNKNFDLIDCSTKSYGGCSEDLAVNFYPKTSHRRSLLFQATPKTIIGIVVVVLIILLSAICLCICYVKNRRRYRGYESL